MREIKEIKEIQDILFDILCYFDEFCCEHGINYFISNGTLLGAAKYSDFVPWDDDVDVLVPREDYDKLMQLSSINNGKYRLLCGEQVVGWRMPYAKLSCENTILKEGEYNFGEIFGVSLDIFPIDNWSSNLCMAKIQAFRSECLKRLLVCSIGGKFLTQKTGLKKLLLKLIWIFGKTLGFVRIKQTIIKSVKNSKRKKSKYAGCRIWTCHLTNEVFPSEYFEESDLLELRGRFFPVLKKYEIYLNSLYGDWKEELPLEKQHSNHDIRVWYKDAE